MSSPIDQSTLTPPTAAQVHPASPDELKAAYENGTLFSANLVGEDCDCDSDPDCPTLPPSPPILTRSDTKTLATKEEYDNVVSELRGEQQLTAAWQQQHDTVLLELIRRRTVVRPKPVKKTKKSQGLTGGGPKKRRRKAKTPAPVWMSKDATLDDLVAVLDMDQETDEIYIDVKNADPPYDTLTLPMLRHFIRKARQYPSICSKWNTVSVKQGDERLSIPMNGRNATRTNGAACTRAYAAMDVFADKLGFTSGITTNVLKDLGYGSKSASTYRAQWHEDRGLVHTVDDLPEYDNITQADFEDPLDL